jgi:hypothetical protein
MLISELYQTLLSLFVARFLLLHNGVFLVLYQMYCAEPQVGDMQLAFRAILCAIAHKSRDITKLTIFFER